MRKTNSRDGQLRITVRIDHRLTKEQVGILLANYAAIYGIPDYPTKAELMGFVRERLTEAGSNDLEASLEFAGDIDMVAEWGIKHAERLWGNDQ